MLLHCCCSRHAVAHLSHPLIILYLSSKTQEIETSVVAVLSPRVKPDEGGSGGVTLSVDKAASLFKLGTAADFVRCKAERRDGRPCRMPVNGAAAEYCCFHAGAALKAMTQSGRKEVSGSGCGDWRHRRMQHAHALRAASDAS